MRFQVVACLAISVLSASAVASGQRTLSASKGWVKAPAAGAGGAAAFVTVENPGMYDIYVVSASSDAAGVVELRGPGTDADAPAALKEAVVPAYNSLEMTPTGWHLWLTDLKRPLKVGDTITIVLMTDGGVALEAKADVREK
jgi:periplasmic copper chaperone A